MVRRSLPLLVHEIVHLEFLEIDMTAVPVQEFLMQRMLEIRFQSLKIIEKDQQPGSENSGCEKIIFRNSSLRCSAGMTGRMQRTVCFPLVGVELHRTSLAHP